MRSDPPQGARLGVAPAQVTLYFDEAVVAKGSEVEISVVGKRKGKSLPLRLSHGGLVVRAAVPFHGPGVYRVTWQVTSADDGHLTRGSFAFGVGPVSGALPASTSRAPAPGPLRVAATWAVFAGLALAAGGLVTGAAVDRTLSSRSSSIRLGLVLAILGALLIGAVPGQGAGGPAPARVTHLTLLTAAFLALTMVVVPLTRRRWPPLVLVLGAVGAWAGLGHGEARVGPAAWGVEALHLAAVAVWAGALAHLVAHLARTRGRGGEVWAVARRYARLALVSVALLAASGLYLAISLLPRPSALWGSAYGEVLLAKSALLLLALALALASRGRGIGGHRVRLLRWLTPAEAGVLASILVLSSLLVDLGPPPPAWPPPASSGPRPSPATWNARPAWPAPSPWGWPPPMAGSRSRSTPPRPSWPGPGCGPPPAHRASGSPWRRWPSPRADRAVPAARLRFAPAPRPSPSPPRPRGGSGVALPPRWFGPRRPRTLACSAGS